MPYVPPSAESVMDESYPLRRFLYLYADKSPKAPLPALAEEFLAFVNSREGQEAVIKAGFYPLPVKQVQQSLAALTVPSGR
jgi:phosphate transport system substrate-binding protein